MIGKNKIKFEKIADIFLFLKKFKKIFFKNKNFSCLLFIFQATKKFFIKK